MSTIVRSTKASGGTAFASGTTILAAEVNTDFNTIYADYNGNVSAPNLASNAVTEAKILDGAVTINKLAANSVNSGKIVDLSIVVGDLAVGAGTNNSIQTSGGGVPVIDGTEAVDMTVTLTTPRGGKVLLMGTFSGTMVSSGAAPATEVTIRIRKTSLAGAILAEQRASVASTDTATQHPWSITVHATVTQDVTVYVLTTQRTSGTGTVTATTSEASTLEFA